MFSNHFHKGLFKGAGYTVQINEKLEVKGRTGRGAIDCGLAVLHRKKEAEWIWKLRTVYPYGLNDRIKDNDRCNSGRVALTSIK